MISRKKIFLQKLLYWMEYLLPTYLNILLFPYSRNLWRRCSWSRTRNATLWKIGRFFQGKSFFIIMWKNIQSISRKFFFSNQGEESNSSANKCMLKVAMYAAQLENYERAIRIYEQVPIILFFSCILLYNTISSKNND